VRAKTLLKTSLLLTFIFLGAFSLFMLRESIRLGYCSNVIVVPEDFEKISWAVGNASEARNLL